MPRLWIALVVVLTAAACNRSSLKPGFCRTNADCKMNGWLCDQTGGTWECYNPDASMPDGDAGDGGDGRDGGDGGDSADRPPPFTCDSCADAGADGAATTCDFDASRCVECLENSHCVSKSTTTPICQAQMCRPCRTDDECPAPNVCLTDGHCATGGEVIFVDYSATACPGDGLSDTPFCTIPLAMPSLMSNRNVLIIRGPADDKLILSTTDISPVVVGKKNSAGADASIPAGAGSAISVASDQVLIRDLVVAGGTATSSKGIVATGSPTLLTLSNVTVSLMTGGLGIQADSGAQLIMDRCTVTKNPVGGLLINGASYDIQNSIFAENGYGVQFNAPTASSRFRFNTVVGTVASFCDLNNPQTLNSSIVVGANTNCVLQECVRTAPAFSSSRPYRLTAKLACPDADASSYPSHDIDNDVRTSPLDCGADQFQ